MKLPRRRRHRRRPDEADQQAVKDRIFRFNSFCFFAFLAMTICQAVFIILVGCFSYSLNNGALFGPMEVLMMSHLWIGNGGGRIRRDDDVVALEDRLADQTAARLDQASNSETGLNYFFQELKDDTGTPLDDYYSRPHITVEKARDAPILIVGGSDGSGTRAVVGLLGELGVPMLVDDDGTLDVHAPILFHGETEKGWPPLVRLILQQTHSADYTLDSLPDDVRERAIEELRKFEGSYDPRVRQLLDSLESTETLAAENVRFGFKAPVSMLLLPIFLETFGRIKFLHIVRDGRDIALSQNTSPVDKFYKTFYTHAGEKTQRLRGTTNGKEVEAMQLWNDWNSQVLEWERRNADGRTFDFLVIRTEDLLSPETKFENLVKLADFVGSPRTVNELCCLSRQALVDMGKSTGGGGKSRVRLRHKDKSPLHGMPPEPFFRRDTGRGSGDPGHPTELDDESDITLEEVALESERKALDTALRRRPEIFRRIQEARTQNIQRQRERRADRFSKLGDRFVQAAGAIQRGEVHRAGRPPRNHGRRLSDEGMRLQQSGEVFFRDILSGHKHRDEHQALHQENSSKSRDQHFNPDELEATDVVRRYGKWRLELQSRPQLSDVLHKEGAQGLQSFGYEPPRRFADRRISGEGIFCEAVCSTDS